MPKNFVISVPVIFEKKEVQPLHFTLAILVPMFQKLYFC